MISCSDTIVPHVSDLTQVTTPRSHCRQLFHIYLISSMTVTTSRSQWSQQFHRWISQYFHRYRTSSTWRFQDRSDDNNYRSYVNDPKPRRGIIMTVTWSPLVRSLNNTRCNTNILLAALRPRHDTVEQVNIVSHWSNWSQYLPWSRSMKPAGCSESTSRHSEASN